MTRTRSRKKAVFQSLPHYPNTSEETVVDLSAPTLTTLFRRRTGLPPHAFLVSCRIAKAKETLARTRQGVAEIARQLGFPSSQYFATQFKRETGLTPRAWRRQNQEGAHK